MNKATCRTKEMRLADEVLHPIILHWMGYLILVVEHHKYEYANQLERMHRCMAEWKIFLKSVFNWFMKRTTENKEKKEDEKKKWWLISWTSNYFFWVNANWPGPLAPPAISLPRRNITARSYSCTTYEVNNSQEWHIKSRRMTNCFAGKL